MSVATMKAKLAEIYRPSPDLICFINNLFIHCPETPEKMTLSDAVCNLCCWTVDDVEIPEGTTPEKVMLAWNWMVDEMNKYDIDESDDSDEI